MIRLLKVGCDNSDDCNDDNGCCFSFEEFSKEPPPYAILSHTWREGQGDYEVKYHDIINSTYKNKDGYKKLEFCREEARNYNLDYFWIDTCCINTFNSAEHGEALRSMFRWYQNSERCFVYLSDVSRGGHDSTFKNSRWFTRGWTLQELLAPKTVEFYTREAKSLGDKKSLSKEICEVTNINLKALHGTPLPKFSIEQRASWMAGRQTKREEDIVYCQMGIFDVSMNVLYGEGEKKARRRLQQAINAERPWWTKWATRVIGFQLLVIAVLLGVALNPSPTSDEISPTIEVDSNYPIFAILGRTGVGKSSFIKLLGGQNEKGDTPEVGHGLEPCEFSEIVAMSMLGKDLTRFPGTNDVKFYSATVNGSSIYLMDTPGFDDVRMSDREVMELIFKKLVGLQKDDKLLKGLIYLHDINQVRVGRLAQNVRFQGSCPLWSMLTIDKQFDAFHQLLGPARFQHLMFVTTKWPENPSEAEEHVLQQRRDALHTKYWHRMIRSGAQVKKFTHCLGEAQTIILDLINAPRMKRLPSTSRMDLVYEKEESMDADSIENIGYHLLTDPKPPPAPKRRLIYTITFNNPWLAFAGLLLFLSFMLIVMVLELLKA